MKRIVVLSLLLFTTLAAFADAAGAKLYRQKACHGCHGADGSGNTPIGKSVGARDLRSEEVQKQSDEALAAVITEGRGKMPSFKSSLSPQQIRLVIAHIRSLKR